MEGIPVLGPGCDLRPWALVKAFSSPFLQFLLGLCPELWKPTASLTWFCHGIQLWKSASRPVMSCLFTGPACLLFIPTLVLYNCGASFPLTCSHITSPCPVTALCWFFSPSFCPARPIHQRGRQHQEGTILPTSASSLGSR